MYVDKPSNKNQDERQERVEGFFAGKKEDIEESDIEQEERFSHKNIRNALLQWRAPEYEISAKDRKWYLYAGLALVAVVAYALYTNSPVMAITFVLVGVVGYILVNKEPRVVDFSITVEGIMAGRDLYEFDNIQSFWIFYEPGDVKVISLHMKNKVVPFVHIPVHDEDPVRIREILLEYLPEVKQRPSAVDTFERLLGI